jgi:nucleotide-binding universal stress UspA family protein
MTMTIESNGGNDMNIGYELTQLPNLNGNRPRFCKNILAPIDLRKEASVDLSTAIALAENCDADLWLLGFSAGPAIASDTRGLCHFVWDSWDRHAQVRLLDCVLQAREHHYRTFPLFIGGNYNAEEIVRTAEHLMADLIVVPNEEAGHRFGSLKEPQADELLRKSPTPVFVAVSP